MKKVLCLILSVMMLGCLTGCLEDDVPKKETGAAPETVITKVKKEENFGLNETAVFRNLKFTATELRESYGNSFFKPEAGNVFVGVNFTIENISDEDQIVSSILLFDGYADDVKCSYSFSAVCAFDGETLDGTIIPGKKIVGWYALEVPQNWSSIELAVKAEWLSGSSANFIFSK